MGAAMSFAFTQGPAVTMAVFLALGFGLALPWVVFSMVPALVRLLPRPGEWMERFKQFLAFPMYGAAAWLVWVVSQQVSPAGLFRVMIGLVCLGLAAWALYGAAKCALRLAYYETALYDALEGLSFCPSMAELHLLAGNACYALGRMEDAKAWAYSATLHGRTVRGIGLRRNGTNDPIALFDGPLTLLAEISHALGNKADERQFRHEAEVAAVSRKNFCERGVE